MKNLINYYYNLFPEEITSNQNNYYFFVAEIKYYLINIIRPYSDLDIINDITEELKKMGLKTHTIIINKEKKLYTKYNEKNYVLLMINSNPSEIVTLTDIMINQRKTYLNNIKTPLIRSNWAELWENKIDYFEYQVSQLGKNKEIILNSFSYYVGLAENAISYVRNCSKDSISKRYCLNHKKIYYPNNNLNYLNPLSFIFDLKVRDVAEYIKSLFFNNQDYWNQLCSYLESEDLTKYEAEMLYARFLYPSYYFDMYENIMNGNNSSEELIQIIEKVDSYETFLKDVYKYLSVTTKITEIDWIAQKKDFINPH